MRERFAIWVQKNLHWILLVSCVLVILFLGWAGTYLIQQQRHVEARQVQIVTAQAEQLRLARAVVRCSLREELSGLRHLTRELELNTKLRFPNTSGIDCTDLLQRPLQKAVNTDPPFPP